MYVLNVDMSKPGPALNAMQHLRNKYSTMSTLQDVMTRWSKEFPHSYLASNYINIYNYKKICFYTEQDCTFFMLKWT